MSGMFGSGSDGPRSAALSLAEEQRDRAVLSALAPSDPLRDGAALRMLKTRPPPSPMLLTLLTQALVHRGITPLTLPR